MKKATIKCPHCGAEYLAGQIFLPKSFVGQPTDIVRNLDGNILNYQGDDMDLEEQYTCDVCNKKFKVEANVTFKTSPVKDLFDEEDSF